MTGGATERGGDPDQVDAASAGQRRARHGSMQTRPVAGVNAPPAGEACGARGSRTPRCVVDAPSRVCFDPPMAITGPALAAPLDPFWVSRRADQFDQVCR
ncbi:hypothetical protein GCM10010335_08360 [Streptomyces galbus]|nr:hypothetical protein GCM10010335_08360 [Streptomyces galbus]